MNTFVDTSSATEKMLEDGKLVFSSFQNNLSLGSRVRKITMLCTTGILHYFLTNTCNYLISIKRLRYTNLLNLLSLINTSPFQHESFLQLLTFDTQGLSFSSIYD